MVVLSCFCYSNTRTLLAVPLFSLPKIETAKLAFPQRMKLDVVFGPFMISEICMLEP